MTAGIDTRRATRRRRPALVALPSLELPAKGHRVRVERELLYSRRRTALPDALAGMLDLITDRDDGIPDDLETGRRWLMARLGVGRPALDRALADLDRRGLLASTQRGCGLTAERTLTARPDGSPTPEHVGHVDAPGWTMGTAHRGRRVAWEDWRGYMVALDRARKARAQWCALGCREMGKLLGIRPHSVGPMNRRLAAAGLVLLATSAGQPDVVLPLVREYTADQRETLTAALAEACGYAPGRARGVSSGEKAPVSSSEKAPVSSGEKSYREDTPRKTPLARHMSSAPVGADRTAIPREAGEAAASPPADRKIPLSRAKPPPAAAAPIGPAPSPAALELLAQLPRPWRECAADPADPRRRALPPWLLTRIAACLDRALTDPQPLGRRDWWRTEPAPLGAAAILAAVQRYAPDPAHVADRKPNPDKAQHVAALSRVLAMLMTDVSAGVCRSCGDEHPGRACGDESPWWAAADPGQCAACDTPQPTARIRPGLPLAAPICDLCLGLHGGLDTSGCAEAAA